MAYWSKTWVIGVFFRTWACLWEDELILGKYSLHLILFEFKGSSLELDKCFVDEYA